MNTDEVLAITVGVLIALALIWRGLRALGRIVARWIWRAF